MPTLSEEIIQVLTESQNNLHSHTRLLKSLNSLYDKHLQRGESLDTFFEIFFAPFSNVLLVYKRESVAQRVIDFTVKFAVSTAPRDLEADQDTSVDDSDQEVETTFFSLLLDRLLSLHEAQDKAVRFRVCQLVSKLLSSVADDECVVGSRLLDKVQEVMLERVLDKVPVVRVHAVSALEYLQSPDLNCPVSSALLSLLATDSSPDVRRCALNKITVSDRSLPAVIERTRDVKEMIRREAFLWLANKCSIRHLTIRQRIQLLSDGLNDHSDLVQEACVNGLLRSWSLESLNGDFITLLSRLDVESSSEVAGLALWKLFDNFSVDELVHSMAGVITASHTKEEDWDEQQTPTSTSHLSVTPSRASASKSSSFCDNQATPTPVTLPSSSPKVIAMELLRCEEAFYWSQLCLYLRHKGAEGEEKLEQIIPTTSEFCDYLQRYVEEVLLGQENVETALQYQFVVEQLCKMFSVMDPSDEVGRRRMAKLVCDLLVLPNFPSSLVRHLLNQQTKLWPQETHRVEVFTDVIADLRQPSANVTAQECVVDTTINSTVLGSQFSGNVSVFDLKDDNDTLLRCLAISCEMLKELKQQRLSPTLRMLVDALLLPCVQNVNPYVRDMAVSCLGLAALLDIHIARELLLLFVQVSQVDHESVQATALKVVFDLLHVFGFEAFNVGPADEGETGKGRGKSEETEEDSVEKEGDGGEAGEGAESELERSNETMQRLLNIMAKFLEGESSLLSVVAAEGIAKLLLSRRILSQKLLAKLLVLWYNPLVQEESRLRSVLGNFFPMFAASDRSCQECLSEVYMPVLTSVFEAPPTSPLYEIDAANMADFVIQLTRPTQPDEESVHDSLAFVVSNAILSDPLSVDVRVFTRSLSHMTFTASNQTNAADLLVLCEKMRLEVTDKISLKYIDKLKETLRKINPSYEVASLEDQLPESQPEVEGAEINKTPGFHSNNMTTPLPSKTKTKNTTKRRARTAVQKKTRPLIATGAKTTAKAGGRGRRKRVVKLESSSSEESESENLEPATVSALPKRVISARVSKSVAATRLAETDEAKKSLIYDSEDSDDSLVGEHSPFVKHTASKTNEPPSTRQSAGPLKVLQYSDDDS